MPQCSQGRERRWAPSLALRSVTFYADSQATPATASPHRHRRATLLPRADARTCSTRTVQHRPCTTRPHAAATGRRTSAAWRRTGPSDAMTGDAACRTADTRTSGRRSLPHLQHLPAGPASGPHLAGLHHRADRGVDVPEGRLGHGMSTSTSGRQNVLDANRTAQTTP